MHTTGSQIHGELLAGTIVTSRSGAVTNGRRPITHNSRSVWGAIAALTMIHQC